MDRPNVTEEMLDEFIDPKIIMHDVPPGFPTDINGLKKQFVMFQTSTPGYHTVDVLLAEGDMVAGKVTGYGTHEGERSEEHTSELQSRLHLVCRLLLEKKKK